MDVPPVTVTTVGPAEDGGPDIESWRLVAGPLVADVLTWGARLHALHVPDRDGRLADVVVGPADLPGHVADEVPFAGSTVGRWANRLRDARVTIDGTVHQLVPNEGGNLLHGGPDGFDRRPWTARDVSDGDSAGVELALTSPDGDQGFPGTVTATSTYRLLPSGVLVVTHSATTDAPTVVSMTNHAHWNLGGGGSVADHELAVRAGRYLPVDDALLPTGVAAVDGTNLDFRRGDALADALTRDPIDHCLLLDDPTLPAAVLTHRSSGRRMTLTTDLPALHVYVGAQMDPPYAALALEPELPPDAPNRPDLDLPADGVLRPGEIFHHVSTYVFDTV